MQNFKFLNRSLDRTLARLVQWFLTFLKKSKTKLTIEKTNKNIPRRNEYILENISSNIFKFCILKYITKRDKNLPLLIYFEIYSLYIWRNRKKINLLLFTFYSWRVVIIIKKKKHSFIISRNTCKQLSLTISVDSPISFRFLKNVPFYMCKIKNSSLW